MWSPLKLGTCGLLFLAGLARNWAEVRVGDPFPSLAAAGLEGGELPALAGKVAVVDFWASWCAPCKASFPALARLQQAFGPERLVIVAVSVDEKPAAYTSFVKSLNPPFATLRDRGQLLVGAVKVPAMPASYVLDRRGRVRFLHQGFHGGDTEAEMRRQIATLLAEQE